MIETHPFGIFVPLNIKYLILGSFSGRQVVKGLATTDDAYDWFYGTRRNQFWPILEAVYGVDLRDKPSKQALFSRLGMGIADIIYQCERRNNNNLDSNLVNIIYAKQAIAELPDGKPIDRIFFTSRFVEKRFRHVFKDVMERHRAIKLVYLPSPSPRYAVLNKDQKIERYKALLPKL
jgi:hypoxanthine-DNA glycosylase